MTIWMTKLSLKKVDELTMTSILQGSIRLNFLPMILLSMDSRKSKWSRPEIIGSWNEQIIIMFWWFHFFRWVRVMRFDSNLNPRIASEVWASEEKEKKNQFISCVMVVIVWRNTNWGWQKHCEIKNSETWKIWKGAPWRHTLSATLPQWLSWLKEK